ncbi:zinc-finger associated domain (zf-AD) domain-containing protein [Phthorimaea operculella]|nr:zinc-finger associated domain (zf-AD) domain-containing protein [Phthorimaea operculella]
MPPIRKLAEEKPTITCRICLSEKNENYVEFELDSPWAHLIEFCLGFAITEAASGPKALCEQCSKKLQEYCEFKRQAIKSDAFWNSSLATGITDITDDAKEKIEIKTEFDEYLQAYDNEDCSESFPNAEYLDIDYSTEELKIKQPGQYFDVSVDINPVKEEAVGTNEIKHKSKKIKKEDKRISKPRKGLTKKEYIKKFFEVVEPKKANGTKKFVCQKCAVVLHRVKDLPLHVQKCYKTNVLMVKTAETKSVDTRTEASREHFVTPSSYSCGLCAFQDAEDTVVMKHVKEEHCRANNLHCKLCDFIGRDFADVLSHRYKHIDQKYRGKYRCPECDKITGNEVCLQFHYRTVHLKKKAGGWCHVCNKSFTGYIYFRNHLRLHEEAKYICDLCGAKFLFRNVIVAHIKEHMNVRNYICDTCGKSFKRNNALSGHIRAYHTDLKPVVCSHCNKQFKNAYSLKLHMKMVKKGNNFICDVCCKGYANMSLLKKHMFWHSGDRPYACETCGGKYKSKGNLNLHMRKHMGIYPFKCDSCEKQFSSSSQLKVHSSVHTGIRRHKCLVCEKTFNERRQMLAHCTSKHEAFMVKQESHGSAVLTAQVIQIQQGTVHPGC